MSHIFKSISPGQVGLTFGALFANFFYHHKHAIRVGIDMEPKPERPTIQSDPPTTLFDPTLEEKIDKYAAEIEKYAEKKKPVPIKDSLEYRGDYKKKDGKVVPNGKGVYYDTNSKYRMVGNWKEGDVEGYGVFRYPEGMLVKTEFKNGQINGQGVKYFGDVKFEGNLVDGSPSGTGAFTFRDNTRIFIKRENNVDHAKCYNGNGDLWYRGEFKNGRSDGYGEFFYPDGRKYEGEFKAAQKDGKGVMKDEYGDVLYDGEFVQDKPAGYSHYIEPGVMMGVLALNVLRMVYRR